MPAAVVAMAAVVAVGVLAAAAAAVAGTVVLALAAVAAAARRLRPRAVPTLRVRVDPARVVAAVMAVPRPRLRPAGRPDA